MSGLPLMHRREQGGTPRPDRWGVDSEYGKLLDVLVGPPDHFRWLQTSSFNRRSFRLGFKFDPQVARRQHAEMVAAYREAGVSVHFLAPDPNLPYQIFARDSNVMTPWGAIITQMAHAWRRGEYAAAIRFYHEMDIPIYDMVTAGAFEGGDFQVLEPGVILCGYSDSDRTQKAAFQQVKGWVEGEGWEMVGYEFDPFFVHADTFIVMLAEKLAAVCIEAVEADFLKWLNGRGIEIVEISFRELVDLGCNVVALGAGRVLLAEAHRGLKEKCRALGLTVFDPDISMISPAGGGMHCMCQPLRRESAAPG